MKQSMQVLTSSETQEWYTPPEIIDLVREVMGDIDLDPASHHIPQQWIQAKEYYTCEDDGFNKRWGGRVFLNPPYGKSGNYSNQALWMGKLRVEMRIYVTEVIALTKTVPGYNWWDRLFNGKWPGPMCITEGRVSFISGDGERVGKSKSASSFWYYGPNEQCFITTFSKIGRVIPHHIQYVSL